MCKVLKWTAFWLMFVGAVNWGLVGLFGFDLVAFLLGDMTLWSRIIYGIIGLAAFTYLATLYTCARSLDEY